LTRKRGFFDKLLGRKPHRSKKTSKHVKRIKVEEKVLNIGTAEEIEMIVLAMEADLMVREARATVKSNNRLAQKALAHMGDGEDPGSGEEEYAKAKRNPRKDKPFWAKQGSFSGSRRQCENRYLASVVEFLHTFALQNLIVRPDDDYPSSRYTIFGYPVTIEIRKINSFLSELYDKKCEDFRAEREDPFFLNDLHKYRTIIAKPVVRQNISIKRDLLVKNGFDLALKQAEKDEFGWEFGWSSDSE
jgi:hypothetical protein